MSYEERSIQKNKFIITISVLVLIFVVMAYILQNSTVNDTLYFHHVYNQNTGEPFRIIDSILVYILLWFVVGLIPCACMMLFVLCLYCFLHRKDKQFFDRRYCPIYEEECDYGWKFAQISTYVAVLILMVLHISNAVTINAF